MGRISSSSLKEGHGVESSSAQPITKATPQTYCEFPDPHSQQQTGTSSAADKVVTDSVPKQHQPRPRARRKAYVHKKTGDRCVRCITFRRSCDGKKPICGTCSSTPNGIRKCEWPPGKPTRSQLYKQMEENKNTEFAQYNPDDLQVAEGNDATAGINVSIGIDVPAGIDALAGTRASASTSVLPQKRQAPQEGAIDDPQEGPATKRAKIATDENEMPDDEQTEYEYEEENGDGEIPLPPRARGAIAAPPLPQQEQSHLAIILGEKQTSIVAACAAHAELEDRYRSHAAGKFCAQTNEASEDATTTTQFTEDELVAWNPSDLGDLLDNVPLHLEDEFFDLVAYMSQPPDQGFPSIQPTGNIRDEDANNYVKWFLHEEPKQQEAARQAELARAHRESQPREDVDDQVQQVGIPVVGQSGDTTDATEPSEFIELPDFSKIPDLPEFLDISDFPDFPDFPEAALPEQNEGTAEQLGDTASHEDIENIVPTTNLQGTD